MDSNTMAAVTEEKPKAKVIVLEQHPDKGIMPIDHLKMLISAQEWGDRKPLDNIRGPMPTAIVREAIKAYALNIELLQKCRELNISQESNFTSVVRVALETAIRLKHFEMKKFNNKPKRG